MPALFSGFGFSGFSGDTASAALSVLLILAKATIVLLAALGVTRAMERGSAVSRHLVWFVALGAVLLDTDGHEVPDGAGSLHQIASIDTRQLTAFATLARGDIVQGLHVDSVSILPDPVDSFGWMGQIDYAGPVELVGEYRAHMDFPEVEAPCFFVDDSVAGRLPRFPNDVRRAWFCFENAAEVVDRLGPPDSISRARIVIDRFHYHYQHTDIYNVARLARVLERQPGP